MINIVIATHGNYADGVLSAIHMIVGENKNITCLNAYTKEKHLKSAITSYFLNITKKDEVIILTDLFGGSVNQQFMPYSKQEHVYVITGFNLALLLEIVMLDNYERVDVEQLRMIVKKSKSQIMFVNDVIKESYEDDFDE